MISIANCLNCNIIQSFVAGSLAFVRVLWLFLGV
jgi:hypothetical protein